MFVYSTVQYRLLRGVMSYNIHISVHNSRFPPIHSGSNDLYFCATRIQVIKLLQPVYSIVQREKGGRCEGKDGDETEGVRLVYSTSTVHCQ
jgi:hypothetical protein